jgi:hypothetical protein|uniref:Uncharacterized protein n=1 Tax=Zea mays TaxID=4577 RepID=C4IZ23_MAIZE|nr:unknown [Zea mays]ACR36769.1 unknown [Zea mays]
MYVCMCPRGHTYAPDRTLSVSLQTHDDEPDTQQYHTIHTLQAALDQAACRPNASSSDVAVAGALGRHGGAVAVAIGAVVVDGVAAPDLGQAAVLRGVEVPELRLVPPARALGGAEARLRGGLAAVDVEAAVGGDEGRVGPVRLLAPAAGRPVVGVPQAGVELHRLAERVPHAQVGARVLEHPDRHVVHEEPGGAAGR